MHKALKLLKFKIPNGISLKSSARNEVLEQVAHRWLPNKFLGTVKLRPKVSRLLELGHIFYLLGRISLLSQNTIVNKYTILRGLNLVERAGPSHELALFMASASMLFGHMDMVNTAGTLSKHALSIAHQMATKEKFHTLAYCSLPLATYRISVGSFDEAEELLNQCSQLCWKIGDMRLLDECYIAKIVCFDFTGRRAQSAKLANELLLSARSRGDQQLSEWANLIHCNALLANRKSEEAIKTMEDSEEWMSKSVGKLDPAKMATFYSIFALGLLRIGRKADAHLATEHISQWILQVQPTSYFLCYTYYNYADVCLSLLELSESPAEKKTFGTK